ncbi:DUF4397 domain-containing protein [Haladaptatus caseinilyticus]|uniref:DUF4397 domain-containing protein n=1 Tax=Haladaptatus caseinilyticus TaxID=2993314 RepID=UPI00224AF347|nr:DUF4397 domain-containing protein [Haladaptatus caseinilyticus]
MQQTRRSVLKALGLGGGSVLSGVAVAQTGNTARVRGIYAIPGGPNVDVFVDETQVIENIAYKQVSPYFDFAAGRHTVRVVPVGQDQDSGGFQRRTALKPNTDYTVAVAGTLQNPTAEVFTDDNTTPSNDRVRLRVVHLSPDAPPVNITTGEQSLVRDLTFGEASEYRSVQAGSYQFTVTPTGQSNPVGTFSVSLTGGTVVTVFAVGLLQSTNQTEAFDLVSTVDARR